MSALCVLLVALLAVFGVPTVFSQGFEPNAVAPSSAAPAPTAAPGPGNSNPGGGADPSYNLCMIFFSAPGDIDYPWTSAISMTVQYKPSARPNSVNLTIGWGTRIFTNKYNQIWYSPVTLLPVGASNYANNLLFTNGPVFDNGGIAYSSAIYPTPNTPYASNNPPTL